jgi:hypothetical protein
LWLVEQDAGEQMGIRRRETGGGQVGATTVTDMWVRMAYLQFSRIIMLWFKLSLWSIFINLIIGR